MKTTSKRVRQCLVGTVLLGLLGLVLMQHEDLNRLRQENRVLQEQAAELNAQLEQQAAEQERLAQQIAAQKTDSSTSSAPAQSSELLRLRGEVGRLRLEQTDAGRSRQAEMEARDRLPDAEAELARVTKLRAAQLVSVQEFSQAQFAVELLKAQAKGDKAEEARLRLRQAEEELARAAELRKQSAISRIDYDEAARKVESLRAATN
jgi:chromosome segregation protein